VQESVGLSQRARLPVLNRTCNFKYPFCSSPILRLVFTSGDYFRQVIHTQLYVTGHLQNPLGTHSELFNLRTSGLAHPKHMNHSIQCNVTRITGAWVLLAGEVSCDQLSSYQSITLFSLLMLCSPMYHPHFGSATLQMSIKRDSSSPKGAGEISE
jgi:hypothetical protein